MMVNKIIQSDCLMGLLTLDSKSVNCCVTSPPYYGLRDYGNDEQIGLEETPEAYVTKLVKVFSEVKRVLRDDGTLWLNLGDSYSSHKDCKSVGQTLAKGTNRETAHVMELGKSRVRDTKMLKSQGLKNKDLIGIPWMVAFALRADGWYLRQDIIWNKQNPMPESVTDRCTKAHEYIFLLSKSAKYYYDAEAIFEPVANQKRTNYQSGSRSNGINGDRNDNDLGERSKVWKPKMKNIQEKGQTTHTMHIKRANGEPDNEYLVRNKRSVWTVNTKPYTEAHFATYPELLIEPCIKAGCPENGVVLDPFMGAGTTAVVSRKLNRNYIGFELNPDYIKIANNRLYNELGMFL